MITTQICVTKTTGFVYNTKAHMAHNSLFLRYSVCICHSCYNYTRSQDVLLKTTNPVHFFRVALPRVIVLHLETGLTVTRHVRHNQTPFPGEVLCHPEPQRLVPSQSMEEQQCGRFFGAASGSSWSLIVAEGEVFHVDEFTPQIQCKDDQIAKGKTL